MIQVRLGEHNLTDSSQEEVYRHQDREVQSVRVHPQYDNVTLNNDIAVIRLSSEVGNTVHVSPVCVPRQQENFRSQRCAVIGWGNRQAVLKELPVECLGDEACLERLRATKLGPNYRLDPSFFCAQSTDQSSCLIDGGGPLACRRSDGSYAVVGLLSWSVDDYTPDVYTRVQQFTDFIQQSQQTTTTTTRGGRATETAAPPASVPMSTLTSTTTTIATEEPEEAEAQPEISQSEGSAVAVAVATATGQSSTSQQTEMTSTTQVIEPPAVRPVPMPPVVIVDPEEGQNEVADESKKMDAFAYSYASSS